MKSHTPVYTHTHTHPFNGPFPGLPKWAGTRKVKPIWILLKQETVSGSGISWAVCKSVPRSRQITTPAPHHSVFYRPDALPAAQPTASKHWKHKRMKSVGDISYLGSVPFSALTLFVGWQEWHHSCKTRATYYKGFISKHVKEKKTSGNSNLYVHLENRCKSDSRS